MQLRAASVTVPRRAPAALENVRSGEQYSDGGKAPVKDNARNHIPVQVTSSTDGLAAGRRLRQWQVSLLHAVFVGLSLGVSSSVCVGRSAKIWPPGRCVSHTQQLAFPLR